MKNVTKTNILFTFMTVLYLLLVYIVRLVPADILGVNMRLILPELIMLLPAFVYVTALKPEGLGDISFKCPSFGNVVRIILFTFCIIPAISLISGLTSIFAENQAASALAYIQGNPLWLNLILIAVIPAVCEEYLFRGLIFNGYKRRNLFGAMLMSSLLFGLIHMNVSQFLYAFVMGVIFCLLNYATGTVFSSMIAHCFFNGYNVIMSHIEADILKKAEELAQTEDVALTAYDYAAAYGMLLVWAIIFGFFAYKLFKRICEENKVYENVKLIFKKDNRRSYDDSQGRFFDWYGAVGIALCLTYIVVYYIV